jgi:hypothetical protein
MDANGGPLASDFLWGFSTGTPAFQENQAFGGLTNPTVVRFSPDGRVRKRNDLTRVWSFDWLSMNFPGGLEALS